MSRSERTVGGTVAFACPPEVAFDYLVDPHRRPEWQSSLAAVEQVVGEPGPGQRWIDVTRPGLRPAMETTTYERAHRWSERGTWRAVRATLDLTLTPTAAGCDVAFGFRISGPGPLRPLGLLLSAVSVLPVRADLRRAARNCA
ncbi:Polyketide cyclase / dehydrase and lipid transport [Nocardioides dokdonensis FR1436]|uniref:Polyketide cyclase / dehydrase and lipid transport n=1 Tax=Nocardioides dokdonensis FR1436 TaxID=1300347 RepID=A0A1A9GGD0_9ACTN|nr:SRPBCC family protein [Nocardioides dokdonensis]ANH37347.1 Polyketide cyclase / dehydrase and lipid transport [Nocardioides dokdonensis FR1436]